MPSSSLSSRKWAVLGTTLVLALVLTSDGVVQAGGQRHGLTGTWFISIPGGLTGFYTYHSDGTVTGSVSTIFGAQPQPPGPATNGGADHGVWRRVRHGYRFQMFRMLFDQGTGDPVSIIGFQARLRPDPGRDRMTGTWTASLWVCPTALTCPDPNTTPPDLPELTPPPPFDTMTQTRVRLPR